MEHNIGAKIMLATVAVVVMACDEPRSSIGPGTERAYAITASATGGASSTWTRGSIFVDGTGFIDCLGEDVRIFGEDAFILHQVTSASGVTQSFFQFTPITPSGPEISLQGLTSGRLYQLQDGLPVNQVFQFGPDSTFSYVEKDVYVNVADKFDKVTFVLKSHVTLNANGEVRADRTVLSGALCGSALLPNWTRHFSEGMMPFTRRSVHGNGAARSGWAAAVHGGV
jgi:hypothetical protein